MTKQCLGFFPVFSPVTLSLRTRQEIRKKPYFLLAEKYVTDRIRNLPPSMPLKMEAHKQLLCVQST